ncbi:MAG: sigma-54 dependent transcriptional regulator [Syntrophales bacterium]|nr:sigma-54 dependent transcriptional regulator [Syntrophales bacterium]
MRDVKRILVVDDEPSMRMALSESLESCGYKVDTAVDGFDALNKFDQNKWDLVITDIRMPKISGLDVLREVRKRAPTMPVILITAYGTVNTAVEAMKEGATDFIMKPFSLEDLEAAVKKVFTVAIDEQRTKVRAAFSPYQIVTRDEKMLRLLELLRRVAKSKATVLIQGESGTGKELLARYICAHSDRSEQPFVAVNCAAIPANLLESEMFGYEKGAFTGANQRKIGKFELANNGTLLLDEISEMDIQLQAKLLRAIQESEIDRVGGKTPIRVDVRIIATTNIPIRKAMEERKFREDLYYRLNVIPVKIPPLRERKEDIEYLTDYFLEKYCRINNRPLPRIAPETKNKLLSYDWPGNVRELENVIEGAILICDGATLLPEHLLIETDEKESRGVSVGEVIFPSDRVVSLYELEKAAIFHALSLTSGNREAAAKLLGISIRTLRNKLKEYREQEIGRAHELQERSGGGVS